MKSTHDHPGSTHDHLRDMIKEWLGNMVKMRLADTVKMRPLFSSAILMAILLIFSSFVSGISFTGFFKAFDVTLSPGERYERNITVRKFYNVSVRFQKEGSSSYLSFDDANGIVVLKDASGVEIVRATGIKNGRVYIKMTSYELVSIAAVSVYNISRYEDVVEQPVNDSVLSLIGPRAYITVTVHSRPAKISGYVIDDLTGELLSGVVVAAFESGANPNVTTAVIHNVSDNTGRYLMVLNLTDNRALDVYVNGYDVV